MRLGSDWAWSGLIPGMWTILQLQFSSRYRVSQSMRQALMLYVEKYSESMGVDLQSPHGGGRYWSCDSKRHMCLKGSAGQNKLRTQCRPGTAGVQKRTTSRQNPTHSSNINDNNKSINKIKKNRSISMTMATDTVGKFRPALSVTWQADVMQDVTDAGLVPGRKQNTMGLETGSQETVKYVVSDRTPQSIDSLQPWDQISEQDTLFKWRGTDTTALLWLW